MRGRFELLNDMFASNKYVSHFNKGMSDDYRICYALSLTVSDLPRQLLNILYAIYETITDNCTSNWSLFFIMFVNKPYQRNIFKTTKIILCWLHFLSTPSWASRTGVLEMSKYMILYRPNEGSCGKSFTRLTSNWPAKSIIAADLILSPRPLYNHASLLCYFLNSWGLKVSSVFYVRELNFNHIWRSSRMPIPRRYSSINWEQRPFMRASRASVVGQYYH